MHYKFNVDAKTMFGHLSSADFLKSLCESLNKIKVGCQVRESNGKTRVVLDRSIRRGLLKVLVKMLNPENRMLIIEACENDGDRYVSRQVEKFVLGQIGDGLRKEVDVLNKGLG